MAHVADRFTSSPHYLRGIVRTRSSQPARAFTPAAQFSGNPGCSYLLPAVPNFNCVDSSLRDLLAIAFNQVKLEISLTLPSTSL